MGGIAEALVSTVLGVTISIICAVAYSAFDDKVKDIVGDLKSSATYYISYIKGEVNIV
jgi:biopolymer transport protein ExbB/TolQ